MTRIGVQLPEVEREVRWQEYLAMATAAEEARFDSIYVGDHLLYRGDGRPERGPWAAWETVRRFATVERTGDGLRLGRSARAVPVAASFAEGETIMQGLGELRLKESDRLGAVARGLAACGVRLEEGADSLTIHGRGAKPAGGARIETALDHRIAMAFLVLGMAAQRPVAIDDASPIDTSFPGFAVAMNNLGARLAPP